MILPIAPPALSAAEAEALSELYRRGTPENTLRAWERDLAYIAAWKLLAFGEELAWPEREAVALRRSLACPAPATLDRRIASWRAFHRMKYLASPFDRPLIAQARGRARRAAARPRQRKSANPVTREVLEKLLATCDASHRGLRDSALLMLGWASGGRRRAEIVALNRDDIDSRDFAEKGLLRIRLLSTKTTGKEEAPRLPLKGRAARALMRWIAVAQITDGPLFRPVSQADRVLRRRLSADGVRQILRHRLQLAGYPAGFASPYGLRAGFLTQAALDHTPLPAAMQLSLHRSVAQAQSYYADVDITENPATELLG